jgi:hypothetical protein
VLGLGLADPFGGNFAPMAEVRGAALGVVSVRRQNMHQALIQHALGPVLGGLAKPPGQGPGRDLHPRTGARQALNCGVVGFDPAQALGMGQHRDVAGGQELEEQLVEPLRRHVVWRLYQHIPGIGDRQEMTGAQAGDHIGRYVHVCTGGQLQVDALRIDLLLQLLNGLANLRPAVVVKPRQDVWRAGDGRHPIGNERPGHGERHGQVRCAVVDAWQNMAVQIDHGCSSTRCSTARLRVDRLRP